MAQQIDDGLVSVEEYLEMEERSEVRHEYVGGMLYAMVGGTDHHNRIAFNIARSLADAADDGPCRVYINDMRFLIGNNNYYYPDVMVACEPPETENPIWRTNPCLVVEVLSPGSASIDHREKLLAYRSVSSVETYLIVHQDVQRVERHYRNDAGAWARGDHVKDGYIPIPCPEMRLTLADIYRGL